MQKARRNEKRILFLSCPAFFEERRLEEFAENGLHETDSDILLATICVLCYNLPCM